MISKRLLIVLLSLVIHLHVDARGDDLFNALGRGDSLEDINRFAEDERYLNDRDENGNTPLHVAAGLGRIDAAELLVAYGANLVATNNQGATPQNIAEQNGHQELAQFLDPSDDIKEPEVN